MSLYDDLRAALPALTDDDFHPMRGNIVLRDDSDGKGAYIAEWNNPLPLPDGFKIGK